jgi:8-oxo-dGTP pyrophosphatase MutT (NUDIX family)
MNLIGVIIFRKKTVKSDKYEFLLLKRRWQKGGFWQFAGGRIEDKESITDAAYREVFEETGINKKDIIKTIKNVHEYIINRHYLTDEPITPMKQKVYAFEIKPDTAINISNNPDEEHEKYLWLEYPKILPLLKWQNNKDAFTKIKSILKIK